MRLPNMREVADLDPFDLLDAEARRIDGFFSQLQAEQWHAPTRCEGWDRRVLLTHLAVVEDYTQACLDDTLDELMTQARQEGGLDGWGFRRRAGHPPEQILKEWRLRSADSRRRLRERGPAGTMTTSVGPYPVGRQTFYLASESAIHADDAGVPVEPGERAARLAWRVRFSRVALREYQRPAEVEPTAGGHLVRLQGLQATLSDEDFMEAAAGRLPATHPLLPELRAALAVLN
jgi:uncharacterized protein (TIGR03083 family)